MVKIDNIDTKDVFEGLTDEQVTEVLEGMVEKGLITKSIKNGEVLYSVTDLGKIVHDHMISDPSTRN